MGFFDDMAGQMDDEFVPSTTRSEHYQFVMNCLNANERGDGMLFARMLRGKFWYHLTWKKWLKVMDDGDVLPDIYQESIAAVEVCALEYERVAESFHAHSQEIRIRFMIRASKLRTLRRAKKVLFWAPIVDHTMTYCDDDIGESIL